MPQTSEAFSPVDNTKLNLLPSPRNVSFRGAPFRPTPSNYLYVSTNANVAVRRKCHILCKQLEDIGFRTAMDSSSRLEPTEALFTTSATFPKWDHIAQPLREAAGREGYRLSINSEGALLHGADEQGIQYAGATLRQLLEDGPAIPGMEIEDYPLLPWRVMHLDFKGWPPNAAYLKKTIAILAGLKINAVILEYESHYNFPSQPGLADGHALTPAEAGEIELFAQDLGVALIPLVPCIGNAAHVLKKPEYADLREHPQYFTQYCPVNPASLDVVTAMMDDLRSVHQSKFMHIGGDDTYLMGAHPNSAARIKQLGGPSALYLEHVGKVCRYLLASGHQALIWDDMFRNMSDEQIKWLPPEAVLTAWKYEGQRGRASQDLLTHLERYKRLNRRVWGAATRSPSVRYDSFDNIDAWTEAAELGLLEGLVTTTWTRDHSMGALLAPPENAWPGAFYAAERAWSGSKGMTRDLFPTRFVVRMFGIKDVSSQNRLWAGFDFFLRDHPRKARDLFASEFKQAERGRKTLSFLDAWLALATFKDYVRQFESEISGNFANLQAGRGDPFQCGRLRWRVMDARKKLPAIISNFQQQAGRLTNQAVVQEYLESSVAYSLARMDEMENLLSAYPLPSQEWQQPVKI